MEMVMMTVKLLRRLLPRIGPYVVMEIVLPGGTLIALLVYLYHRRAEQPTMPMSIWRPAIRDNNPPAEPKVFRLRPPQRGLIAIDEGQTRAAVGIMM